MSADLRAILEIVKREIVRDKETGQAKVTHTSTHPACKVVKDSTGTPKEVPITNQESVKDSKAQLYNGNVMRGQSRNNRKWLGRKHQNLIGNLNK